MKLANDDRRVLLVARKELARALKPIETERSQIEKLEAARQRCDRDFENAKLRGSAASPATARIIRETSDRGQLIVEEIAERQSKVEELSKSLRGTASHTCRVLQCILGSEAEKKRGEAVRAFTPYFSNAGRAAQLAAECDAVRQLAQFVANLQPAQDELAAVPDSASELLDTVDSLLKGTFRFPGLK